MDAKEIISAMLNCEGNLAGFPDEIKEAAREFLGPPTLDLLALQLMQRIDVINAQEHWVGGDVQRRAVVQVAIREAFEPYFTTTADEMFNMIERRWREWNNGPVDSMNRGYATAAKLILQEATAIRSGQ